MKDLFKALKDQALPAVWSQGVKLARDNMVSLERTTDDSLVLRVRTPGQVAYCTAVLYPEDLEWTCDCTSPADPCRHVVAAVIVVHQAAERGAPLAKAEESAARLLYDIQRTKVGQIRVARSVEHEGRRSELQGSLTSAMSQFGVNPGPGDLVVDQLLAGADRGILSPHVWPKMLEALSEAAVELDGQPVRVSTEPVLPAARVSDSGQAIVLTIEPSPAITDIVGFGLALCGDTLRPLGAMNLGGLRHDRLPLTRQFQEPQFAELATRVLPELESTLSVAIETTRLPRTTRKKVLPRLVFDVDHTVHALSVVPRMVYGSPPQARIADGKMVSMSGAMPPRDEPAERALVEQLRDRLNLVLERRVDFDGIEADRFATKLRAFQGALGERESALTRSKPLVAHVRVDDDVLSVEFVSEDGDGETAGAAQSGTVVRGASAESVLRAWREGLSMVALEGGGWAPLPTDWLSRYGDRVADLLAARDENGRTTRAALPTLATLCDDLNQPRPPSFAALEPLFRDFHGLPAARLPDRLHAVLRDYQHVGVNWLCFLRDAGLGAVLADDMGLGKTLQTLCALRGRALVVCPKSVVHNWEAEIRRFRPGLRTALYEGPKRALDPRADVTITTYPILRLDADRLSEPTWDTLVLDEAQAIKNPDSQVAQAAYGLKTTFPVALSGTPVENRLEELWSIFHVTHRGLLGGRAEFRARYALPVEQGDQQKLGALRTKTKPFILRRLKRDVAPELPPRTDVVLEVDLEPPERDVYAAIHAATRRTVLRQFEQGSGNVMQALEALLRLRQAACHPSLIPGQGAETSSKVDALLENLDQVTAEGHKALVFSQWTSLLDLVEPHLDRAGIRYARLDGSTPDRAAVVRQFQADSGPPVLLTSLKAGGTGLNLTAADHVFLLDPWWNPAAEDQAADRAHRIGQERPVLVYRLIARNTVEEGILRLQDKKRGLADAALEGTGTGEGITRDDLLALLA